ncbi:unnamed protein product [Pleuronectes platessa]|uniref:Uncharacterized protein n=1 Tax=Pleuronectes platessa TaxID=8262 RepID=A0A9N7U5W7_PLEPL|nr:unnamed protein product [Pleuronectes platessa]
MNILVSSLDVPEVLDHSPWFHEDVLPANERTRPRPETRTRVAAGRGGASGCQDDESNTPRSQESRIREDDQAPLRGVGQSTLLIQETAGDLLQEEQQEEQQEEERHRSDPHEGADTSRSSRSFENTGFFRFPRFHRFHRSLHQML